MVYKSVKIGTLRGEIIKRVAEFKPFQEQHIMKIIHDIASGLKFLHSQAIPIIARNIKVIFDIKEGRLYILWL